MSTIINKANATNVYKSRLGGAITFTGRDLVAETVSYYLRITKSLVRRKHDEFESMSAALAAGGIAALLVSVDDMFYHVTVTIPVDHPVFQGKVSCKDPAVIDLVDTRIAELLGLLVPNETPPPIAA